MHECSLQSWSAYHLYEKPGNSGENLNGTVHPGGNVPDKRNTFRGITFFPFSPKRPEIFCTICLVNQCQASSWGKRWFFVNPGLLVIWCFANCTTLTHSSFRKRFHFAVTISQKPFTEMFLQMVSVPGPDFEYAPLSRPSLFHRLNNSGCIIHQRSYSIPAF